MSEAKKRKLFMVLLFFASLILANTSIVIYLSYPLFSISQLPAAGHMQVYYTINLFIKF